MLFYTEGRRYKNLSIWDERSTKVIAKFENNKFETEDEAIILKLKNSSKYKMVMYDKQKEELEKERKEKERKEKEIQELKDKEIQELRDEIEKLKLATKKTKK